MGFPHPTVDVPGRWPVVAAEVRPLADHDPLAVELYAGLNGEDVVPGHVCGTAFVVTPDHRRLLLVQHRRLGWSNPGGHLERHESSFDAACRELHEETGLVGLSLAVPGAAAVHVTDVRHDLPHRHWNVAWAFVADMSTPLAEEDGVPVAWFDVDALPDGAGDLRATWAKVSRRLADAL